MRPRFNKNITLEQFQDHYWYKKELQELCKQFSLPSAGGKLDLKARLEKLIQNNFDPTKVVETKERNSNKTKKNNSPQILPKNINEKIPSNFTCSELYRAYFKSVVGEHFHFTAYMMKYLRQNPDITFKDYIDEWKAEHERRKDKSYKPKIMKSTEYNQYFRDFFADNKGKSRNDAIKCWNYKKTTPGPKKYERSDLIVLDR